MVADKFFFGDRCAQAPSDWCLVQKKHEEQCTLLGPLLYSDLHSTAGVKVLYGYYTLKDRTVQFHEPKHVPSDAEAVLEWGLDTPFIFFLSEPVAFRRVYGLESYSRTSRESNHHRQSVSDTRVPRYQLHHEHDWV